jgi:hypothetical protein
VGERCESGRGSERGRERVGESEGVGGERERERDVEMRMGG